MTRLKYIYTIIVKDLLESLQNKTILIVIILPLAASLLFSLIDSSGVDKNFRLGIVEENSDSLYNFVEEQVENFIVLDFPVVENGLQQVKSGRLDALIMLERAEVSGREKFSVYINSQKAINYFFIKDSIEEILKMYLQIPPALNYEIIPLNINQARLSFLPIWITITITMIGILIISGNLAEEKENKTLQALFISPARDLDIIWGKGIYGIILAFITVIIMCLLNGAMIVGGVRITLLIIVVISAAASFTAIGLLIGAIAQSQSAARALGTIIYFPLLFPILIYDLSEFTRNLARLFPAYYLQQALEKILLLEGEGIDLWVEIVALLFFALILSGVTYWRFKRIKG